MEFLSRAIHTRPALVVALGASFAVWGFTTFQKNMMVTIPAPCSGGI